MPRLFRIEGIKPPGRVNVLVSKDPLKFREVKLFDLTDEQLWRIYQAGECPFIIPTEAGYKKYFPSKKIITTQKIITPENVPQKSKKKKPGVKPK